MKTRDTKLKFASLWLILILIILQATFSPTVARAQRGGSAAKGGSPVRELVRSKVSEKYRPGAYLAVTQKLGLNHDLIAARFFKSHKGPHPVSFKNILICYLIARELSPNQVEARAEQALNLLDSGYSFDKSIQIGFALERHAVKRLKDAARAKLRTAFEQTSLD